MNKIEKPLKAIGLLLLLAFLLAAGVNAGESTATPPPVYPNARLFGFVHFWSKVDNVAGEWRNFNFNIARARLGATGEIRPGIAFMLLTEGGELANTYLPGSRAFNLVDCHATFKLKPWLNLRLGQDFYRFTYEGDLILPKLPFIYRAAAIDAVWLPMGRNGLYAYDFGIWIFNSPQEGNLPLPASYQFSLTNGTGLNKSDDNEQKDFTTRVYLKPFESGSVSVLKNLQVGGSAFVGTSKMMVDTTAKLYANLRDLSWAVELILPGKNWRFLAEGLTASYQGGGIIPQKRQWGGYAACGVTPVKNLELLARYELFDQAQSWAKARLNNATLLKTTTLGLTYTLAKLTDVKVNYLIREYGSQYVTPANLVRGNLLIAQVQLMW